MGAGLLTQDGGNTVTATANSLPSSGPRLSSLGGRRAWLEAGARVGGRAGAGSCGLARNPAPAEGQLAGCGQGHFGEPWVSWGAAGPPGSRGGQALSKPGWRSSTTATAGPGLQRWRPM